MANDNPTWGYRRITAEVAGLGYRVGASTVWRILKQRGIDPAPQRTRVTWTQFLRSQAAVACDFATVDTVWLHRYYLLFFIDISTREVFYGGITANPTGAWTTQAARNLFVRHHSRFTHTRALLRDRANQFTDAFDEVFRTEDLKILKTPARAPTANSFAERWIGTLRRELLDPTPSSGTNDNSNTSSPTTSTTTTPTGPTARSINGPRHRPNRQTPTGHNITTSSKRHAAAASSTSTEEPPDQQRQNFGHPQGPGS